MIIKQVSVFVENKPGKLAAVMNTLADHDIDISALSLADTADFGVLRLILDQPEKGKQVLQESGVACKINHMVAVVMEDVPGGAAGAIQLLADHNISIEYMYACIGRVSGKALMVVRVQDYKLAEQILEENHAAVMSPDEIYRISKD